MMLIVDKIVALKRASISYSIGAERIIADRSINLGHWVRGIEVALVWS